MLAFKLSSEYAAVKDLPMPAAARAAPVAQTAASVDADSSAVMGDGVAAIADALPAAQAAAARGREQDVVAEHASRADALQQYRNKRALAVVQQQNAAAASHAALKPSWRAPWRLMRVIAGHTGWVRSVAVDPTNQWFVTGSADRTIKVWNLASGELQITLTGHISAVRGLAVSPRHPYLFSCGEDKMVKCWDLETNKVIRSYHGHTSGVYALALHPELDILVSAGRDSVGRVWDMRTKAEIMVLAGHDHTICSVVSQAAEPQIVTASVDCTVRLWDVRKAKTSATLTNHKKSVRALAMSRTEYTFASASRDNIKKWLCPDGSFLHNIRGHDAIVNTLALNDDGVLVSGADDGSVKFWDYATGYNFCSSQAVAQPGSLDSESGVFCAAFDATGSRLITGEADKSIKIWREDERATPASHPLDETWSMDASRF